MTRQLRRNSVLGVVVIFISILITLAAMAVAQVPPVHFANAVPYVLDAHFTNSVVAGDLNADGKPDLVVVSDSGLSVLLGKGDGTFHSPANCSPGGRSLALEDLNRDGKLDLVVVGSYDDNLSVLLGKGDGTFQAASSYPLGNEYPMSVAVADVNGDGKLDLVAAGISPLYAGVVSVLLGNGDGTFQPAVMCDSGGYWARSVAVDDVNGDGHPDLVVADSYRVLEGHSVVGVLLGNGTGTFQLAVTYEIGGYWATSVAVADLNGDGKPDVVVANGVAGVGVLLGNGDGTFQAAWAYPSAGDSETSVAIADVNGDGILDLVVTNATAPPALHVLLGNGNGTFQTPVKYGPGGWNPSSVAIADMNADSKPDLLVANYCTVRDTCHFDSSVGSVSVLLNNFTAKTSIAIVSSLNPSFVHQLVTFTATVTSIPPIADGRLVTFYDGTKSLASVALAGGKAAYSTSSLSATTHFISARYSGDTWHKPGYGSVKQVVNKYPTTTTMNTNLNPSNYGQAVTLTATVTSAGPLPTGTVTFKNGSVILGGKTLNASGVAIFATTKIPVGANTLTATYNGDTLNGKSVSAAITQVVN